MAGEYGIGVGIAQGLDKVTQGMKDRQAVQQQAAQFQATMVNQGLQQQSNEVKLQEAQMQLQELQKQIAKRDTWDVLSGYEQTRDASVLNTINTNPMMKDLLNRQGITSFSNINDLSEEKKTSLGIDSKLLEDPTKRIVLATTTDGRQVPMDLMSVYATTGFLPKLGEQKLKDMTMKVQEMKLKEETLKANQMEEFFKTNPNATYGDWQAKQASASQGDTADIKNTKYMASQLGISEAEYIKQQQQLKTQASLPAEVKTSQYNMGKTRTILEESGVQNIPDIDVGKLSPESRMQALEFAKKDQKNIDEKQITQLGSIQEAARKLNPEDLAKTTGIVDATFNSILDTLGITLPDEELVQSSNYNLLKNTITRLNAGTAVTGSEMDRMVKQIGNEFKADRTVQIKTAETLDNMAATYEMYSKTAPWFYAAYLKDNVKNLRTASDKLRSQAKGTSGKGTETTGPKVGLTQEYNGVTYRFKGGDPKDKNNWEKVK